MDRCMELALIKLINEEMFELNIYLENYQKVDFQVYGEEIIKDILRKCKFKDIGNVYDYPDTLPQPEMISGYELSSNFNMFQRIAVSKKINSIVLYTTNSYYVRCTFLIDTDYLEIFSKNAKLILQRDTNTNMFREIDFKCRNREYIEISNSSNHEKKPADIVKKKIIKEKLIFTEDSTIMEVMKDIDLFFKEETHNMYKKLQITYKRGVILYGEPGNGKSAMIREIIRILPRITKIVINPNINDMPKILSILIKSLNGKRAIIIIEDIDSLINGRNRSEFLNILDGIDIQSGVYFIGTTNYPEHIDPAFMNRSGRFDRTYKIDNPSENIRRAFFQNRNIGELLSEYKVYKDDSGSDTNKGVIELFVKYSNNLPMGSLKEIMTGTKYLLACNNDLTIEEAVETTSIILTKSKNEHVKSFNTYKDNMRNLNII